jgi:predicted nucleic acid-binding protein
MKKVYLDTNVIMDIVLDRFDKPKMLDLIKSDYIFIISDVVIDELKYNEERVSFFLQILNKANKIIIHVTTKEDIILGKKFMEYTHHNDALHAAICCNLNIPIVTRNTKDFKELPIKIIHSNEI